MNIKLEVEALVDVSVNMNNCCSMLNEVCRDLKNINIDFWQGNARNAFDSILKEMQDQSQTCTSRLGSSVNVISEALKKYNEIEIDNIIASSKLPANDIF